MKPFDVTAVKPGDLLACAHAPSVRMIFKSMIYGDYVHAAYVEPPKGWNSDVTMHQSDVLVVGNGAMNVDEIRAARIAAELEIMEVILRFKALTGSCITHCHLETVTFCRVEDSRRVEVPAYVRLTVESI